MWISYQPQVALTKATVLGSFFHVFTAALNRRTASMIGEELLSVQPQRVQISRQTLETIKPSTPVKVTYKNLFLWEHLLPEWTGGKTSEQQSGH